jgi:hypothetical protein
MDGDLEKLVTALLKRISSRNAKSQAAESSKAELPNAMLNALNDFVPRAGLLNAKTRRKQAPQTPVAIQRSHPVESTSLESEINNVANAAIPEITSDARLSSASA